MLKSTSLWSNGSISLNGSIEPSKNPTKPIVEVPDIPKAVHPANIIFLPS